MDGVIGIYRYAQIIYIVRAQILPIRPYNRKAIRLGTLKVGLVR